MTEFIDDMATITECKIGTNFYAKRNVTAKHTIFADCINLQENVSVFETKCLGYNWIGFGTYIDWSNIGFGTYIGGRNYISRVTFGRYCSVGSDVKIICGTHPTSFVSTYPGFYNHAHEGQVFDFHTGLHFDENKYTFNGDFVTVGNDVWICDNAKILQGVNIGDGAIIGAGALVTKDVKPYSIVGGNPAKLIRFRFSKNNRKKLLKICWWNQSVEWIQARATQFENIDEFIQHNWKNSKQ